MRLIPKHQNTTGPLLPNNYVVKPAWQQQEENYTPEWQKKLSPQEEARLKTIQESERKRKEHQKAKQTEYLGDWGVMSRSMRTTNPVPVLYNHLQNQGYKEQADQMAKSTGVAEAGVLMTIPTVYGLATAPLTTGISMGTGYLGSKVGERAGEVAESYGAPKYTSDVLGFAGGLIGGAGGIKYAMNSPRIQAAELPFKAKAFNFGPWFSKRFQKDVLINPESVLHARAAGNYPLTFKERRNMLTNWRKDIQEGIDYAGKRARTLGQYVDIDDIDPKTVLSGTKTAARRYGQGAYSQKNPSELGFGAFQDSNGLTFPARLNKNSLLPNSELFYKNNRVQTGAHEAQHEVQKSFWNPLVKYDPYGPGGNYKRYLTSDLNPDVKRTAERIIDLAGSKGTWEGSLAEMDSELVGWLAEQKLPYKYSALSLDKRNELAKRAAVRFGLSENEYPLFSMLFKNMEDAGY